MDSKTVTRSKLTDLYSSLYIDDFKRRSILDLTASLQYHSLSLKEELSEKLVLISSLKVI